MGTEVLDDGGGASAPGAVRLRGEPVVLAFEALPEPPPPTPGPAARAGAALAARARAHRRWLAVVATALVVGAGLGGLVGARVEHRQALRVRATADAAALAVLAYATDVSTYVGAGGSTALLSVQVSNAGPRDVAVAATPYGVDARVDHPVVRPAGGIEGTVAAGDQLQVFLVVAVDCSRGADLGVTIPVVTPDGRRHAIPVQGSARRLELASTCHPGTPSPTAPAMPR